MTIIKYGPLPCCNLCGGTAAMGQLRALGFHSHLLCTALMKLGMPTPSLGDECPECHGAGCHPRSQFGLIDPSQRALDAWAPKCTQCAGTGVVK